MREIIFFGLNFSWKNLMRMNNISKVWKSLEGLCVHQENIISKKTRGKNTHHRSWFCSYPYTTVFFKCVFTTLTIR